VRIPARTKPLLFSALVFMLLLALGAALAPPALAQEEETQPSSLEGTDLPQNGGGSPPTEDGGGGLGIPGSTAPSEEMVDPGDDPGTFESTTAPGEDGFGGPDTTSDEEREEEERQAEERPGLREFMTDPVGASVKMFKAMLEWAFEAAVGQGLEDVGKALQESAFGLPEPAGPLIDLYEQIADFVRPVVLIAILLLGTLMMMHSARYDVAYATQNALPEIAFTAVILVFFPTFMNMVSDLSGLLASGVVGESTLDAASTKVMTDVFSEMDPDAATLMIAATAIAMLVVGFMVMCVCLLKNVFFAILFVIGPFAIVLRVVPGLGDIFGAWFRGILACAIIPVLYSVEIMVGSWIVSAPEIVTQTNSDNNGLFAMLTGVCVLWVMWKTPFKVLGWAFSSYSGKGTISSVAKTLVVKTITKGVG
jgi:hypothetical protein